MVAGEPAADLLTLQYRIASLFARSSAREGLARAVESIVVARGWDIGIAWLASGEQFHHATHYARPGVGSGASILLSAAQSSRPVIGPDLLRALSASTHVCACSQVQGCQPVCSWRRPARSAGFQVAATVPLTSGAAVYGMLEFYASATPVACAQAMGDLQTLGADLGRYLHARRFETRMHTRNSRLIEAQRIARIAYWECSPVTWRLRGTSNMAEVLGLAGESLPTTFEAYLDIVPEEERARVEAALARIGDPRLGHAEFEHHVAAAGGTEERVVVIRALGEFEARGRLQRISGTLQDITPYRRLQRRLRLAATAIDHAGDAIVIFDALGCMLSVNPAFERITGYVEDEVRGHQLDELLHRPSGRHDEAVFRQILGRLRTFGSWKGELWGRRKDGSDFAMLLTLTEVRDAAGRVAHHVGVFTDISRQREYKEHLEQLALHDSLTGLPNRALLRDRGRQALSLSQRTGIPVGLIFMDLDLFKNVNDEHGHAVGDAVLRLAAERMRACMRDCDTVARLGGDEFVVLLTEVDGESGCLHVAERLLRALSEPYRVGDATIVVGASLGVALAPEHGTDVDVLLNRADQALYSVKRGTGGRHAVWSPSLDGSALARDLDAPLRRPGTR